MRKTEDKEIEGGFRISTQKLPTLLGSELRFKLGKLFAGKVGETDGQAAALLIAQLAPDEQRKLLVETFICTSVIRNDEKGDLFKYDLTTLKEIDRAFDGDIDALWDAAAFVWDFNFKPRPTKGAAVAPVDPAP